MFFAKTPLLLQKALPSLLWKVESSQPNIYLTFDDGPTPKVTEWVLETLDEYRAKATFFCIGEKVNAQPGIYNEILNRGHQTGNHTYRHVNGWKTTNEHYFKEVAECAVLIKSHLFRPPYGKITLSQITELKKRYRIVMWNVLGGDYDPNISNSQCAANVISNVNVGSIIVMHDSERAENNLRYALLKILDELSAKGLIFASLNNEI